MAHKTDFQIDDDVIIKEPGKYAVLLHNDEVTTMDFVVEVLINVFNKTIPEAENLMMDVHEKGQGIAGVYTFDIANTKKRQVDIMSAEKGFPLKLTIREVSS